MAQKPSSQACKLQLDEIYQKKTSGEIVYSKFQALQMFIKIIEHYQTESKVPQTITKTDYIIDIVDITSPLWIENARICFKGDSLVNKTGFITISMLAWHDKQILILLRELSQHVTGKKKSIKLEFDYDYKTAIESLSRQIERIFKKESFDYQRLLNELLDLQLNMFCEHQQIRYHPINGNRKINLICCNNIKTLDVNEKLRMEFDSFVQTQLKDIERHHLNFTEDLNEITKIIAQCWFISSTKSARVQIESAKTLKEYNEILNGMKQNINDKLNDKCQAVGNIIQEATQQALENATKQIDNFRDKMGTTFEIQKLIGFPYCELTDFKNTFNDAASLRFLLENKDQLRTDLSNIYYTPNVSELQHLKPLFFNIIQRNTSKIVQLRCEDYINGLFDQMIKLVKDS